MARCKGFEKRGLDEKGFDNHDRSCGPAVQIDHDNPSGVRVNSFRTTKYETRNVTEHVKHILKSYRGGNCSVRKMAEHFCISSRTLTRRLALENTTYREIQGDVKTEMAVVFLSESSFRIADIAKRLGYTDTSNFTKAFKRRTGLTPSRYRAAG